MTRSKWQSKAHKRWGKKAEWIQGDGPFAVLAHCRVLTVTLHATKGEADDSKAFIDRLACGGLCTRNHEIIDLTLV